MTPDTTSILVNRITFHHQNRVQDWLDWCLCSGAAEILGRVIDDEEFSLRPGDMILRCGRGGLIYGLCSHANNNGVLGRLQAARVPRGDLPGFRKPKTGPRINSTDPLTDHYIFIISSSIELAFNVPC